ncbi:MAG TPA: phosphoribosyltransferase family protein [Holophaga sp.]|nr:phosphoribosyltransferase family protein [Holophaga sp.]
MLPATLPALLQRIRRNGLPLLCRGCLRPLDRGAEAGLCGLCWEGLAPLPEPRCPCCALPHAPGPCPDPVAWTCGDALWDYRGGRPPMGALLVPGIKAGEHGWKQALLARSLLRPLPAFATGTDVVTAVPAALQRRWSRGFDLAEDAAGLVAERSGLPFVRALRRSWSLRRQAGHTESERRRLPRKAVLLRSDAGIRNRIVLLVDDVWTTGTTLLRCAQALQAGGAREVRVLTLFRAT